MTTYRQLQFNNPGIQNAIERVVRERMLVQHARIEEYCACVIHSEIPGLSTQNVYNAIRAGHGDLYERIMAVMSGYVLQYSFNPDVPIRIVKKPVEPDNWEI